MKLPQTLYIAQDQDQDQGQEKSRSRLVLNPILVSCNVPPPPPPQKKKKYGRLTKHRSGLSDLGLSGDLVLGEVYPLDGSKRPEEILKVRLSCVLRQVGDPDRGSLI